MYTDTQRFDWQSGASIPHLIVYYYIHISTILFLFPDSWSEFNYKHCDK